MNPIAIEAAKMLIQLYFNAQRLNGKSETEIKELLIAEIALLDVNNPMKLEDV